MFHLIWSMKTDELSEKIDIATVVDFKILRKVFRSWILLEALLRRESKYFSISRCLSLEYEIHCWIYDVNNWDPISLNLRFHPTQSLRPNHQNILSLIAMPTCSSFKSQPNLQKFHKNNKVTKKSILKRVFTTKS